MAPDCLNDTLDKDQGPSHSLRGQVQVVTQRTVL